MHTRILSICSLIFACAAPALAASASAALPDGATDETVDRTGVDDGESQQPSKAVPPSLNDLKDIGAAKSTYRRPEHAISQSKTPIANVSEFQKTIGPVLIDNCVPCHGPDTTEGNIRIDTLDPNLLTGDDVDWWLEVMAVVSNGEMPPADANELSDSERQQIVEWLSNEVQQASRFRRSAAGYTSFRRMTRYEHNYALQDLLGLPFDFTSDLPPEANSEDGFQNSSELLHLSAMQFSTIRSLSRNALERATVKGTQPKPLHWGVSMQAASAESWKKHDDELDEASRRLSDKPEELEKELSNLQKRHRKTHRSSYFLDRASGQTAAVTWRYAGAKYAWKPTEQRSRIPEPDPQVAILPPGQKLIVELGERIPDVGTLLVRVRASQSSSSAIRPPSLQLEFGWQASNDSAAAVKISQQDHVVDASPGQPQWYEWRLPLSEIYPRNSVRKTSTMGVTPSPSEFIRFVNSAYGHGDIQIDYVEVQAPVYEQWPPESHLKIFGNTDTAADESKAARQILTRFLPCAWRRPVSSDDVDQKLRLFQSIRPACEDFHDAMLEVLSTVLASPDFLYLSLNESSDRSTVNNHELATRLSMFLWCSIPDAELRQLADDGRLIESDILEAQIQRMLSDDRAQRFVRHFVRQWLGLQLLDYLQIDRKIHPHLTADLKAAMQQEPLAFFQDALAADRSILDLLHADHAFVNERLAAHYGIPRIYGNRIRRVKLPDENVRGGLLTQAGLLAMNADGKDSHPLKRGIWLLERILNDPPPPPPPAVPEIDLADPEIARLTLKERIENHRDQPACRSCHAKIDPWGIAFENFDGLGKWRTEINGQPVDATSRLFNKERLEGVEGLKRFLLENRQDQFARAIVHKMTTFALGRPLTFGDRADIERITTKLRTQGDGLSTLVRLIATSDIFLRK